MYTTHSNISERGIAIYETLSENHFNPSSLPSNTEKNSTTLQCVLFPGEVTCDKATLNVLPGKINAYSSVIYESVTKCHHLLSVSPSFNGIMLVVVVV